MTKSIPERAPNSASMFRGTLQYLHVFRRMVGWQIYLFVALTVVGTVIESMGIVLFFPLLQTMNTAGSSIVATDRMGKLVVMALDWIGFQPNLEPILFLICALFVVRAGIDFIRKLVLSWIGPAIQENLRIRVLNVLKAIRYSYFVSLEAGHLTNLITQEIPRTATAFARFAELLTRILTVFVYSGISVYLSPRMTFIAIAAGLPFLYVLRKLAARAKEASRTMTGLNEKNSSLILQIFQAFKYLQATRTFERLGDQAESTLLKLRELSRQFSRMSIIPPTFIEPFIVVLLCGLIYVEAKWYGRPLASILLSLVLFQRTLTSLIGVQTLWQGFCGVAGSVDRVQAWLLDLDSQREPREGQKVVRLQSEIRIENLAFAYGEKPVLDGLNLTIPAKTTVAFVGLSGDGKTTLADLILGLLQPTCGSIFVDGNDLSSLDIQAWRSRIGYVPQESVIFNASVTENISLWDPTRSASEIAIKVRLAAQASHAASFIQEMNQNYQEKLGDRGVRLSGGQRQRLAIAREFYREPDLIILDEATSALDSESEFLVQSNIDELKGKTTVILIAHRLSTIKKADRIYVLANGKIVEQGAFSDLIARTDSTFRRMCERQQLL